MYTAVKHKKWRKLPDNTKRELLRKYYQDHFPVHLLCDLMNLSRIPLAFLDISVSYCYNGTTIYSKYKEKYRYASDIHRVLTSKVPTKLEFGAYYPTPNKRVVTSHRMKDQLRYPSNLVIDVDLQDYAVEGFFPEVYHLSPCTHKKPNICCKHCWNMFIRPGYQVLILLLKLKFGFTNCFVVDSGKKGYHLHCFDYQSFMVFSTKEARQFLVRCLRGEGLSKAIEDRIFEEVLLPHHRQVNRQYQLREKLDPYKLTALRDINGTGTMGKTFTRHDVLVNFIHNLNDEKKERVLRHVAKNLYWPRIDEGHLENPRSVYKTPFSCHFDTEFLSLPIPDLENYNPDNDRIPLRKVLENPSLLEQPKRLLKLHVLEEKPEAYSYNESV